MAFPWNERAYEPQTQSVDGTFCYTVDTCVTYYDIQFFVSVYFDQQPPALNSEIQICGLLTNVHNS